MTFLSYFFHKPAHSKAKNISRHTNTFSRNSGKYSALVFYLISITLIELVVFLADKQVSHSFLSFVRIFCGGLTYACFLYVLSILICGKAGRWVCGFFLFSFSAIAIAETICRSYFGLYFQLSFMLRMTSQIASKFGGSALGAILAKWWVLPLTLLPFIFFLIFRRKLIFNKHTRNFLHTIVAVLLMLLFLGLSILLGRYGSMRSYYTYNYSANTAIPNFGLATSLRLEIKYLIFGVPEEPIIVTSSPYIPTVTPSPTPSATASPEDITDSSSDDTVPVVYEANILDIDFESLMSNDSGSYYTLDQYYSSQLPTYKNEYTGLFEGKNLIMITAEAFSYAVIDETLTPTLYKLANNGFVFTDFYQPDFSQSTSGGEFAAMTGIIPTWINGSTAFYASAYNYMPFGLGNLFSSQGYTSDGYHNGSYTYYSRNLTHTNLGYTFTGLENGLDIASANEWTESDLEMIEFTLDQYIDDYVSNGTNFNLYYMTISGHCNYGYDYNAMSRKNWDAVEDLNCSETVKAYIACQLELESALSYMMKSLEEAGIADDTVIVLCPDHYPYAMTEGQSTDYYVELTGIDDQEYYTSRYKNTWILYSGSMEEPVVIDTPCSSVDIIPTLLNLFGIEYDSRLFSGRDVLSVSYDDNYVGTDMVIAIFPDIGSGISFKTAMGTYEALTGTFTPNDQSEEVSQEYIDAVYSIAEERCSCARLLVQYDYFSHLFQ